MSKMCLCYRPSPEIGPMIENWEVFLMPRSEVDDVNKLDPSIQQILPYVTIFRKAERIENGAAIEGIELLSYSRGGKTTEARLVAKRSVGFGGHIDRLPGEDESILALIFAETRRELVEEIGFKVNANRLHSAILGAVRSHNYIVVKDAEPVDSVHTALGIMIDLAEHPGNDNLVLEAGHIEDVRWINLEELPLDEIEKYETWSKVVIAGMTRNLGEYRKALEQHRQHIAKQVDEAKKQELIDAINLKAEESEDKAVVLEMAPLETGEQADYEYDATVFRLETMENGVDLKLHAIGEFTGPAMFGYSRFGMNHGFLFNIVPFSDSEPERRRAILINVMSAPIPASSQSQEALEAPQTH